MKESIVELEAQLEKRKRQETYEKWEKYLTFMKAALNQLVGKTVMVWYCNGGFTMFKVKNVEEKYYIDREGFNGQWSPKRWLELVTEGYLICHVADNLGNWHNPKIEQYENVREFKFKKIAGKHKDSLSISKIDFRDISINQSAWGELEKVYKVGYGEYTEYPNDPDCDRSLQFMTLFSYIVPNEMWDAAYQVHLDNVQKTMDFWKTYKDVSDKSVKVSTIFKK